MKKKTYLPPDFLIQDRVPFRANALLEKGQKHGYNDCRFQTFSEADEEDWSFVS